MKILALLAALATAAPVGAPPAPKPVTLYAFVQCQEPLFLLFVASDGTSRMIEFEDTADTMAIVNQVPKDQRFRVTLADPVNGCPVFT